MYTQAQIDIIIEGQKNNLSVEQIAKKLNKTPAAVRVFMFRKGIPVHKQVKCPLVEKLIRLKFADPSWFRTNRAFYEQVKISQKRFSELRAGYANPTNDEMKRIARVLNVNSDELLELFNSRQLDLFEQ